MAAIKAVGGDLVACCDPFDSVGIIDRYFPSAAFFTEFERFDRHIYKLQCSDVPIDYVTICSPNHLHDAHVRWALRIGASPICEKPLVLNPANLDNLGELERSNGRCTNAILQLRLHPEIQRLKAEVEQAHAANHTVDITTITPRGQWYRYSWKGDVSKSGGLVTNIGVHLFDMMIWIFGEPRSVQLFESTPDRSVGFAQLGNAAVRWFLSTRHSDLGLLERPADAPFRSIVIDDKEIEFARGFEDLHIASYKKILMGEGFGSSDARPAVRFVHELCRMGLSKRETTKEHPLLGKLLNAEVGLD